MNYPDKKYHASIALIATLSLALSCSVNKDNPATAEKALPATYITTFQFDKPDRIDIELFNKLSDQDSGVPAVKKSEIIDENTIEKIMDAAGTLPDKGDIMIKMGDVSIINVTVVYPEKKLYFTVYHDRIKTPDTSFYSVSPDGEKQLVTLLSGILK